MRIIKNKYIMFLYLILSSIVCLNSCYFIKKPLQKPQLFEYNIICDKTEFEQLYYKDYQSNRYINIKICYKNDTVSARLRIRGDTSRGFPKKSFKIECDSIKLPGHAKVLNFNAEYTDKGYVREYLSSKLMQASGQPCFDTEFAQISLNGQFFGLYLRVENVDKEFLKKRNLDPNNNLYKASKDGACLSIYDELDVKWEKKTNKKTGMDDLKMLIDSLNSVSDFDFYRFVQTNFDYDKLINIIAMNMLLQNKSTYYHNYYLYHDLSTGKWTMFPWDMDKTLSYYNYDYQYHETSSVPWISNNPIVERALICTPIFDDIKRRIDELSTTLFRSSVVNPIIENIRDLLENSVRIDKTDDTEIEIWRKTLTREKEFFNYQHEKLIQQFNTYPLPFSNITTDPVFIDQAYIRWHSTTSPQGKPITYKLIFGTDYMLKDSSQTTIIDGLTDTIAIIDGLNKDNKFFWKVVATDGQYETPAFNTYNFFVFKPPTIITNFDSKSKVIINRVHSPYLIDKTITFKENQNILIEKGTTIFIDSGVFINIYGKLDIQGSYSEPVKLLPTKLYEPWGILYILNSDSASIKNTQIVNGKLSCINSKVSLDNVTFDLISGNYKFEAYAYFRKGELDANHCIILGNDTSEAFIYEKGWASIRNSFFMHTADAIEYMGCDSGEILNNHIYYSNDDGIDFDGSNNIIVKGNFIYHTKEKGISVGNDKYGSSSNILIERNVIIGCKQCGIGIKDNSDATIYNNTFYNMRDGVEVYRKTDTLGGGKAIIKNCIFSNITKNIIYCDQYSEVNINYCLADKGSIPGKNNIISNPQFVNVQKLDFRLGKNSAAIDNGDPKLKKDQDGTRSDIGAFPFIE